ncbi:regulatory protein RecX [uncultured Sphingomonas sp.]|uniref:regulatory protein RecX n=1 Tax=uncultured Sphingomonas sp. TaxID=158754 RepID=UPI0035C97669
MPPFDHAAVERLALRYVERYATTRRRLAAYLTRKVRLSGATDASIDIAAIVERIAGLGYVDDRAFGEGRATAMTRRGAGARRIAGALRHAGLDRDDADAIMPAIAARAMEAALAFARRRRIGPFAVEAPDHALRDKHMAAMLRGGHAPALARRVVAMAPGDDPTLDED